MITEYCKGCVNFKICKIKIHYIIQCDEYFKEPRAGRKGAIMFLNSLDTTIHMCYTQPTPRGPLIGFMPDTWAGNCGSRLCPNARGFTQEKIMVKKRMVKITTPRGPSIIVDDADILIHDESRPGEPKYIIECSGFKYEAPVENIVKRFVRRVAMRYLNLDTNGAK